MNFPRTFELKATTAGVLALMTTLALPIESSASAFQSGSIVVYRVGSETGARTIFLDEYRADGQPSNNSINLSAPGSNPLTASTTKSEGLLTRSANGQCLVIPGYAAAPGNTVLSGSLTSVAKRAVALIDANGLLKGAPSTLGDVAFTKDSIRSAASDDCTRVWASGKGDKAPNNGIWLAQAAATTATQINTANAHGLFIANQQLMVGNAALGLARFASDLPTTSETITNLGGIPAGTYRGIAAVKLAADATSADTLYLADNGAGVLAKFSRSGTTWTARGTLALDKIHGLVAMATGEGNALLYASDQNGNFSQLFDTSGATGNLNGSFIKLASANTGEAFYGVALAPEAVAPVAAPGIPTAAKMSGVSGNSGTLQWTPASSGAKAAFYVIDLSRDNFTSVDQSVVANGTSVALGNLQQGQVARVRAVNSFGGSASVKTASIAVGAPPSTTLIDNSAFSGVVGDAHDVLALEGLAFSVTDPSGNAGSLVLTASSSNPAVVDTNGLILSNQNGNARLKIAPKDVGYADITLQIATSQGVSIERTLHFAASGNATGGADTRWFAGRSDASSALMIPGGNTLLVVDDEAPAADSSGNALPGGNALYAYNPQTGGMPASTLVPDAALKLSDAANCNADAGFTGVELSKCKADGEVDMESSFLVGNRMYFAGSHSNNKNGRSRPDRWRVFAVDVNPADQTTSAGGYYQWLREDLRAWDASGAHQLGANYLGLVASSEGADDISQAPESDQFSGFSIEGSTTSPDDKQMWLGFRAPLVSAPGQAAVTPNNATLRTHALIVPVGNFSAMLNGSGGSKGSATLGSPIRLDLGGRGVREIRKNTAGEYLIIAGPPNGATSTAPRDFRLYSWDGRVNPSGLALNLRALEANLSAFTPPNAQCSAEGIATLPQLLAQGGAANIISDCGDADFYADGKAAKDLKYNAWKKFRSDVVNIKALPAVALQAVSSSDTTSASLTAQSAQAGTFFAVLLPAGAKAPSWEQVAAGQDADGQPALGKSAATALSANVAASVQFTGLTPNTVYAAFGVHQPAAANASLVTPLELRTGNKPPVIVGKIDFAELPDRTLRSPANFTVAATGNGSSKPVTFSSQSSAICTSGGANGATITPISAGTCTLRAAQAGDDKTPEASPVERSFKVSLPAASGTSLAGGNGASAGVSGNGWQFAVGSAGSAPTAGLPSLPAGYQFVQATGFSFQLVSPSAASAAQITLKWPDAAPTTTMLWKYGPTKANPSAHWYDIKGQLAADRKSASFSITDGGDGDEDGIANGMIVDPVFLVTPSAITVPVTPASVPSLSAIGQALLALVLAGLGAVGARRQRGA